MPALTRAALVGAALIAGGAGAALAHHGWDWTSDEDFVLEGKIEEIYLGNPHAALKVMAEDPYRLARDIRGIGFRTADAIALRLGLAREAPQRLAAGVSYALQTAMDEGH